MAFQVTWARSAQDQLTEIWIAAPDRTAIAAAADALDHALRAAPLEFGEERSGRLRLGFILPLAVMYRISPEDMRVEVVAVKRLRNR